MTMPLYKQQPSNNLSSTANIIIPNKPAAVIKKECGVNKVIKKQKIVESTLINNYSKEKTLSKNLEFMKCKENQLSSIDDIDSIVICSIKLSDFKIPLDGFIIPTYTASDFFKWNYCRNRKLIDQLQNVFYENLIDYCDEAAASFLKDDISLLDVNNEQKQFATANQSTYIEIILGGYRHFTTYNLLQVKECDVSYINQYIKSKIIKDCVFDVIKNMNCNRKTSRYNNIFQMNRSNNIKIHADDLLEFCEKILFYRALHKLVCSTSNAIIENLLRSIDGIQCIQVRTVIEYWRNVGNCLLLSINSIKKKLLSTVNVNNKFMYSIKDLGHFSGYTNDNKIPKRNPEYLKYITYIQGYDNRSHVLPQIKFHFPI